MDTVQSYKCPCCGAPLAFDGTTQSLRCASCGNEFSAETLQQLSETEQPGASQYDWQQYSPRSFEDTGEVDLSGYSRPAARRSQGTPHSARPRVRIAETQRS